MCRVQRAKQGVVGEPPDLIFGICAKSSGPSRSRRQFGVPKLFERATQRAFLEASDDPVIDTGRVAGRLEPTAEVVVETIGYRREVLHLPDGYELRIGRHRAERRIGRRL